MTVHEKKHDNVLHALWLKDQYIKLYRYFLVNKKLHNDGLKRIPEVSREKKTPTP